jgi:O-antigen/teichoic acid export membrane protein
VKRAADLDQGETDSKVVPSVGGSMPASCLPEESAKAEPLHTRGPRRRGVALNSFWNLAGQTSPFLIAVFAIPLLIRHLGVDRFGVLTIAWILVGYLGLLDLGIGRAVTKLLAEKIALANSQAATSLIGTATLAMIFLGVGLGGALCALAPWLSHSILKIPPQLQSETLQSLYWMALAIPFVTLANGFRGMLEAQHSFGVINVLRVGLGAITYIGPLAVVPFSRNLVPVVLTLVIARAVSCGLHFWLCKRLVPTFSADLAWDRESLRELLGFGGWITLSNIISPIMVYLDRFLIGSLISMAAVAYYTTPFELVTKLWVVPTSLVSVLFPAFSEALAVGNDDRARSLYEGGVSSIFVLLFPLTLAVMLFAPEGLRLWLGADFARRSGPVLEILAIGVFINSLANVPYALLQASGRPDLTAKLHLMELPCYAGLLYWTIRSRGIEGAAMAWVFRLFGEAAILFFLVTLMVNRRLPWRLSISIAVGTAVLLLALITTGIILKTVFLVGSAVLFAWLTWCWTFSEFERSRWRSWLKGHSEMTHTDPVKSF